ncbi:MAG TPA: hypothetical protein VF520_06610 [Thermoleophilaceae bacterium]|jgi:hypothetical protein
MIYCVIPQALADELYERLTEHYKDDPNVEVIVDRREGPDRRKAAGATGPDERRQIRDRRHRRIPGTFPPLHEGE